MTSVGFLANENIGHFVPIPEQQDEILQALLVAGETGRCLARNVCR